MSRLSDFLVSQGYGRGSNVTQHLKRKDVRALHATGIDDTFNETLRKRFPFESVLHYHNDQIRKKWVNSNAIAWTVPINIKSIYPDHSFDDLIELVRENAVSFAEPFLEFARGTKRVYLTNVEYTRHDETSGIIYITFLSNEYLEGELDEYDEDEDEEEEEEEDEQKVRNIDEELLSEAKMEFKKRIDRLMNIISENNMLYNYEWYVEADEIRIEKDVSKLGAKVRRNKGKKSKRGKKSIKKGKKSKKDKKSKKGKRTKKSSKKCKKSM